MLTCAFCSSSVLGHLFAADVSPDSRHGQCCAVEEAEEEEGEQCDGGRPQAGSGCVLQHPWWQVQHLPDKWTLTFCEIEGQCGPMARSEVCGRPSSHAPILVILWAHGHAAMSQVWGRVMALSMHVAQLLR